MPDTPENPVHASGKGRWHDETKGFPHPSNYAGGFRVGFWSTVHPPLHTEMLGASSEFSLEDGGGGVNKNPKSSRQAENHYKGKKARRQEEIKVKRERERSKRQTCKQVTSQTT